MRKLSIFVIGFCIGVGLEYALAEEYTVKITPADADLISEGLQTQPFGKVFPLMNKLRSQILEQQQAAQKVDPAKSPVTNDPAK